MAQSDKEFRCAYCEKSFIRTMKELLEVYTAYRKQYPDDRVIFSQFIGTEGWICNDCGDELEAEEVDHHIDS